MPKLSGVFEKLEKVESVSADSINRWLKNKAETIQLENYLANRIFYPQTIALTPYEMEVDLAILREAIKLEQSFYNKEKGELSVPEEFFSRFLPGHLLIASFADSLDLQEETRVFKQGREKVLICTIYRPKNLPGHNPVPLNIKEQNINLRLNTLTLIPVKGKCRATFNLSKDLELDAGEFGIFIDLRKI